MFPAWEQQLLKRDCIHPQRAFSVISPSLRMQTLCSMLSEAPSKLEGYIYSVILRI